MGGNVGTKPDDPDLLSPSESANGRLCCFPPLPAVISLFQLKTELTASCETTRSGRMTPPGSGFSGWDTLSALIGRDPGSCHTS